MRVSQTGEWKPWLDFFFDGITVQANDAIGRAHRLLDLNKEYHQRVHGTRSSVLLAHLIDKLFEWPATTAVRAQIDLGVSQPAARHSIQRLVDEGILTEVPGRRRNRVFLATEVISIVEAPEREDGSDDTRS